MLFDALFAIALLITGIVSAVKESEIPWFDYDFVFRRGAYSIAAVGNFYSEAIILLWVFYIFQY